MTRRKPAGLARSKLADLMAHIMFSPPYIAAAEAAQSLRTRGYAVLQPEDLSLNLRCVASQRLIPKLDSSGRVAAVEVLLHSPLISDLIYKGDVHAIKEIMAKSRELGMQTFDQALFDLFESGQISYDDALRNADSVNDLRLKFKLNSKVMNPENQERSNISDLDIL